VCWLYFQGIAGTDIPCCPRLVAIFHPRSYQRCYQNRILRSALRYTVGKQSPPP
jgi:hypothetical protein